LYQVGGVHSHLIARIQRDKNRAGFSISQSEIMTTVFPLFQQYIEPHLVDAHVGTRDMSISLFNLCRVRKWSELMQCFFTRFAAEDSKRF
jgi:hypothetical protein